MSRGCWVLMCDLPIKVPLSTPSAKSCLFIYSFMVGSRGMAQQGQGLHLISNPQRFLVLRKKSLDGL